jgi:hypothetical protein
VVNIGEVLVGERIKVGRIEAGFDVLLLNPVFVRLNDFLFASTGSQLIKSTSDSSDKVNLMPSSIGSFQNKKDFHEVWIIRTPYSKKTINKRPTVRIRKTGTIVLRDYLIRGGSRG